MDDFLLNRAMRHNDLEKINDLQEILAIGITIQKKMNKKKKNSNLGSCFKPIFIRVFFG